jgi:hypothetical protein
VSVVCCEVEVSATSWSLVQRSPTECGVSQMCVIMKLRRNEEAQAQAHIGLSSHRKKKKNNNNNNYYYYYIPVELYSLIKIQHYKMALYRTEVTNGEPSQAAS